MKCWPKAERQRGREQDLYLLPVLRSLDLTYPGKGGQAKQSRATGAPQRYVRYVAPAPPCISSGAPPQPTRRRQLGAPSAAYMRMFSALRPRRGCAASSSMPLPPPLSPPSPSPSQGPNIVLASVIPSIPYTYKSSVTLSLSRSFRSIQRNPDATSCTSPTYLPCPCPCPVLPAWVGSSGVLSCPPLTRLDLNSTRNHLATSIRLTINETSSCLPLRLSVCLHELVKDPRRHEQPADCADFLSSGEFT